jgi:hypothetical protein
MPSPPQAASSRPAGLPCETRAAQIRRAWTLLLCLPGLVQCQHPSESQPTPPPAKVEPAWIELFNGRDLTGWTPKIRGLALGEDPAQTFVVRDGLLCVDYSGYQRFDERFGHLFHEGDFARYRLRAEYRFVGEQVPGGPGWAWRNNGLMLHCQAPASMTLEQEFPVSLEMQLLGGDGSNPRHTANLCTPGTHVEMDGRLITQHCIDSESPTCHGDAWVTVEVLVDGPNCVHFLQDQAVLSYTNAQLDPNDADAQRLLQASHPLSLDHGHIAIQAESAPIQFRRIALQPLP